MLLAWRRPFNNFSLSRSHNCGDTGDGSGYSPENRRIRNCRNSSKPPSSVRIEREKAMRRDEEMPVRKTAMME